MTEQSIGPYRLLSVLGQGPNTIVYKAWQSTVGRPVTLKVLRRPETDGLGRLQAEAHVTASLSDPRVRQVYEVGQTPDGHVYVALQYVDNSLRDVLNQRRAQGKPFSRDEIVELLEPVAGVLDEMHRRDWVHLDIKPENILIFKDTRQVVLADFGIAQKAGTTTCAGTPLYASPEQAAGNRPVGAWSDVYSLAIVAYEMVTGRPPFKAAMDVAVLRQHLEDTPVRLRKMRRGIDSSLDEAIAKALSKDPRRRFATAGAFVSALGQRQAPVLLALKHTSRLLSEMPAALKRRPWLGVIPLAIIAVIALSIMGLRRPPPATVPTPTLAGVETPPGVAPVTLTSPPVIIPTATIMVTLTPPPVRPVTLTPTQTPTPAEAAMYSSPILVEPAGGTTVGESKMVAFGWTWDRTLRADERYRFRFWQDAQLAGEAYITQDTWRHAMAPAGLGTYEWGVDIVRVDQAGRVVQVLSPGSDRRQVTWK